MKKKMVFFFTIMIMLIVSRFAVRIVDATVRIDENIGILIPFLVIINAMIGLIGYKFYRRINNKSINKELTAEETCKCPRKKKC